MADGSVIIDSKLDSSGLEKGLQGLGGIAQKGLGAVSAGIAAVSAGLTAAGGYAAKVGMSFDSAMSQVAATMGTTVDQIGILSDAAKEMGATTAFSATEAAQALNYLALAGYDAATAADTLPAVLNLAAAGGMDLAYASDLATDAMSALGIEASNANLTAFGDQMAMTASKANTSVAQLGEAILTVGGTAKSLAGGTTELNTALGVLANRGIKGAEGGTHLRNVILSLTAPTDTAAEAMKKLGVSATDSTGNMRPLNEILADFNAKLAGMTDAQKTAALSEIFNKTDIAAVQGLLAGVGEEWDNLAASIGNAGGAMQTMADTQLDNLEGDITILKSALEGLGIAAYEGFRDPLRSIVQLGTEMIDELSSAMKSGGYAQLSSAIGDVVSRALSQVTGYLPKVTKLAVNVIKGLCDGIKKNIKQISKGLTDALVAAVGGIAEALPDILEAGLIVAQNLVMGIAEALPTLLPKVIEGLANSIAVLCRNAGAIIQAGVEIATALITGIIMALPSLIGGVFNILGGLIEGIKNLFKSNSPEIEVKVKDTVAKGKIDKLKLNLDELAKAGYTITVSESGDTLATLQSFVDKDGNTIELKAQVTETGDVEGFITSFNGVNSKLITLSALKWDVNGAGDLVTTIEDAKGNEITLTAKKDDQGNVETFITKINGLPAEKPIKVTGTWDGSDIPSEVSVDVVVSDANNSIQTVKDNLDSFKRDYASQAVDIQVKYNSAQALIDELGHIQGRAGVVKRDLSGISGYQSTLSGIESAASSAAKQVEEMISKQMKPTTVARFQSASEHLWAIASGAAASQQSIGELAEKGYTEPADFKQVAIDAQTLAEKALAAKDEIEGLTQINGLMPWKKQQLEGIATSLNDAAGKAQTIASELTALSGKQYLSEEDKARMVELTNQLTELYPELSKYVGEGGVLSVEASEVRKLTDEYRQLALVKAAGEYVAQTEAELAKLQLEQQLVEDTIRQLQERNETLGTEAQTWEELKGSAEAANEALNGGNGDLLDRLTGAKPSIEAVTGSLGVLAEYLSIVGGQELSNIDGFENLVDELGNLKSPEEILADANAILALQRAMAEISKNADLNLTGVNEELNANEEKAKEAQEANDGLATSIEQARLAAEQAHNVYDRVSDSLGTTGEEAEGTGESVEQAGEEIQEGGEAAEAGAEAFENAADSIEGSDKTASDAAGNITESANEITEEADRITQAAENLKGAQTAAEAAKQAIEQMEFTATEKGAAALKTMQDTAASITLVAQGMLEAVTGAFTNSTEGLLEVGKNVVTALAQGISDGATQSVFSAGAQKTYQVAYQALVAAVGANGSKFKSIGVNICRGIAAGINEGTKFVVEAAKKAVAAAIAAAKKAGEISSPSKVANREVGTHLATGVAVGIDENVDSVEDSARNLIDKAISAAGVNTSEMVSRLRSAAFSRNSLANEQANSDLTSIDYDLLAQAVWNNMPDDLALNQTINFNRPMQAPDEIARELRQQNSMTLIGGKG